MADVQYEKQDLIPQAKVPENGGFVVKLIKWGIAKDQKQAEYTLLGVTIIALCIGLFFSWNLIFGSSSKKSVPLDLPIPSSSVAPRR